MVKFGVLLLLMICVQASLAKHGARRHGGSENEKRPCKGRKWGGQSVEDKDYTKMRDMSDMMMMMMRMKKMLEPLRVLFVKVLGLGSKETTPGKPKFCGDNECPEFKVLNKSKHYELRMYQPSQWVSTSMQVKKMNRQVIKKCFWRLFNYIQGNNELEQKIKMTVPVTNVFKKDPVSGKTNFTMSFFLPPTITDPPFPNDDEVSIKRKGNFRVYSHSFGGFAMSEKTWKKHAVMLEKMLNKDGLADKYYPHDEKIKMHKLGILFLIIVCVQASISLAEFHQKWNAGSRKVKQSKKDWIREFGENMDHSQMSNEEITEMMMKKMRMKMKRMLQPLRDLFVKVLDLGPRQMVKGRPAFCGNYACPEFKVLNKSKHYELRMYQPSQWVSTSTQGKMKNAKVVSTCFWRLFKYIQGKNELKQKIEMTAPVITLLKSDPTSKVKNFTMSFYLPPTITNPPAPNDNALFIEKKRLKVYAHGFDGYAIREKTWKKHAMMLKKMLKKAGLKGKYYPHDKMYITAVYDDPMKLFNRHNEVWFIAKED